MEVPDKIYVEVRHPFGNEFTEMIGFESRGNSDDIEYIRKDSLWKPNKEQIDAIEIAINELQNTRPYRSEIFYLKSILEQLKKL